ncbi:DUF362 domain-containing protein [Streptacidiphilus jiangxiensis]|uniref:4Fe-4S dicluster domain-containing protein n=1 Tax=Streptacidiphilus jiangxiensis TaxID=235985 RepID=A0A1H7L9N9_STRJI|nr:4Fe-4S binding protein [Streptacidiphilus jiangxiensis]SEK95702.1 4Fe-4S dicluster domain-containing protein [Streptacidiphilus jiangxiensis]
MTGAGQALTAPVRVSTRCQGCGACLLTCPTHAIRPHGNPLLVLADLCTGCLDCLDVCPVDAIDLLPVAPPASAASAASVASLQEPTS